MLDTSNLQRESALKTLPRKISRNGQMTVLSRADYEARGLKLAHDAQRRAKQGLASVDDNVAMGWSRELERWIERERVLLRIPLPQAAKSPEPRRVVGSASYSDQARSEPLVMDEATPVATPATGQAAASSAPPHPTTDDKSGKAT